MKTLKLQPVMSEEEANNLIGTFLGTHLIKHHITEDTEVFNEKESYQKKL